VATRSLVGEARVATEGHPYSVIEIRNTFRALKWGAPPVLWEQTGQKRNG
jgi:hypothetical protein